MEVVEKLAPYLMDKYQIQIVEDINFPSVIVSYKEWEAFCEKAGLYTNGNVKDNRPPKQKGYDSLMVLILDDNVVAIVLDDQPVDDFLLEFTKTDEVVS